MLPNQHGHIDGMEAMETVSLSIARVIMIAIAEI
jgi:FlaG/FlaF family flagellin (archaellin)